MYSLGIPDEEIRQDLSNLFAAVRANKDMDWASQLGGDLLCGSSASPSRATPAASSRALCRRRSVREQSRSFGQET